MAHALHQRGIDVLTPEEAGLRGAPDDKYLMHSLKEGRVLVTNDDDFLRLHGAQQHAGIVYCEQRSRTIGRMVRGLVLIYEVLEPGEIAERVEFI